MKKVPTTSAPPPAVPETMASVTFQTTASRKVQLEDLASGLGLTRMKNGIESGNTSMVLNLFIRFAFDNPAMFKEWMAQQVTKATGGKHG